jgi:hypothetical protein
MAINATWHKNHPMPKNPSMNERVKWHVEHEKTCGCRKIPASIKKEMRLRKIKT